MGTLRRMYEDRIANAVRRLKIDVQVDDRLLSIRGRASRNGGESSGERNEIAP
jgi:hypothetical protein